MLVPIKVKDEEDLFNKCTSIWMRFMNLTKREGELYRILLKKYIEMIENGVKEPYISQIIFGTDFMREVRTEMNLTHQNFNNLKMSLKKKSIIFEEGDSYRINPAVAVHQEITFKFV